MSRGRGDVSTSRARPRLLPQQHRVLSLPLHAEGGQHDPRFQGFVVSGDGGFSNASERLGFPEEVDEALEDAGEALGALGGREGALRWRHAVDPGDEAHCDSEAMSGLAELSMKQSEGASRLSVP